MSTDETPIPEARARRSRWFGLVWAVPLAAAAIVVFLGVRGWVDRGIEVVVTFDTAGGARVNDTKVIYQGVEAGKVTRIRINEDGHRVDLTLRIDPRAELGLTTTTRFWLVGANPSLNDIASLKAALAGVTIGVAPGVGGTPTRSFIGLNEPPIVMPGTPGTAFVLNADALGTISTGSSLYYRGQTIGKITGIHFLGVGRFAMDAFVTAPYDALVRTGGAFWISSPVHVTLAEKGLSVSLEHPGALFNGAIEYDIVRPAASEARSAPGTTYALYTSREDAQAGAPGHEVPYQMRFRGPAGDLVAGTPVRLFGFEIGAVKSVRLQIDPDGAAYTVVDAVLYPEKLHITAPVGADDSAGWQRATDALVDRLLARGHRAQLVQVPPLVGGYSIGFNAVRQANAKATLGAGRIIPSTESGGGIDDITAQLSALLDKFDKLPLEQIAKNLEQTTQRINTLVSSPELTGSLQHLQGTLAQADRMMTEVAPKIGPLVGKLDQAADEARDTAAAAKALLSGNGGSGDPNLPAAIEQLSSAARSIRALADYVSRHPQSLLFGRSADAPPVKEGK